MLPAVAADTMVELFEEATMSAVAVRTVYTDADCTMMERGCRIMLMENVDLEWRWGSLMGAVVRPVSVGMGAKKRAQSDDKEQHFTTL